MRSVMKIGLLVLAFLLASPFAATLRAAEGGHEAKKGDKKEAGKAENGAIAIGPLTVNVLSNTGYRYLRLAMQVQCDNNAQAERLLLPDVQQALIFLLSSKVAEDLLGSPGKMILRRDLIELFSKYVGQGKVKNLYFTEFVFQ